jgi:superfamily I DNA/RNA helicase
MRINGIRKGKYYKSRNYAGHTIHISNLGQINLAKGKWLILTRTRNELLKIAKELVKRNLYYQTNKGKSYKVGIYKAALAYTRWCKDEKMEDQDVKYIKEYIPHAKFWDKNKKWYEVFTAAPEKERIYIRNMLENNENLNEDARIFLSTIHAIKGGEADNVVLALHQGSKIQKSIKRSVNKRDEEHRVWYVGITRARNNLYKLKSKIKRTEYQL